jgi:hypothetical protein
MESFSATLEEMASNMGATGDAAEIMGDVVQRNLDDAAAASESFKIAFGEAMSTAVAGTADGKKGVMGFMESQLKLATAGSLLNAQLEKYNLTNREYKQIREDVNAIEGSWWNQQLEGARLLERVNLTLQLYETGWRGSGDALQDALATLEAADYVLATNAYNLDQNTLEAVKLVAAFAEVEVAAVGEAEALEGSAEAADESAVALDNLTRAREADARQAERDSAAIYEHNMTMYDAAQAALFYGDANYILTQSLKDMRPAIDAAKLDILGLKEPLELARGRAAFEIYVETNAAKAKVSEFQQELDGIAASYKTKAELDAEQALADAIALNKELDALDGSNNVADLDSNADEAFTPIQTLNQELDTFNTAAGAGTWSADMDTNANQVQTEQVDPLVEAAQQFRDDAPYEALMVADTEQALENTKLLRTEALTVAGEYVITYRVVTVGAPPVHPGGGGRAAGGPVKPGLMYTVGEQGVELFAPDTPGTIFPNSRVSSLISGMGAAPTSPAQAGSRAGGDVYTFAVDARGATDPAAVERRVEHGIVKALDRVAINARLEGRR